MLIDLSGVSKIYKMDGVEVKALDDVSLKIDEGEFIAITGSSGSGKSTLMHIIGLLDKATTGTYTFEGKKVESFSENEFAKVRGEKVGFVFQSFNLLSKTSSLENVMLPSLYIKSKENPREKAKALLEKVGLGDRLANTPSQLSGGQQQRVAIARSLMNDPQIILADEPTGNLDSKSGEEIIALLEELNREGKTVIIVTHEEAIANRAKRRIILRDGKIIKD